MLEYMKRQGEQLFQTENYVSVPPALIIMDERGSVWTLGFARENGPRGEYAFDVLKDGMSTGEWASRIERRGGKVRIFGRDGWKVWTGKFFI
jgi:hypothetical protein